MSAIKKTRVPLILENVWKPLLALIPLAALFISFLMYQYNREKDSPIIQIIGSPSLIQVRWSSSEKPQNYVGNDSVENSPSNPLVFHVDPDSLQSSIKIINSGQRIARVFAYVSYDTVSFEPVIRREMINIFERDTNWIVDKMDGIYDLQRGDTTTITFVHDLYNLEGLSATLHYAIFYEDDGLIHDTYYWASYRLSPQFQRRVQDYFIFNSDRRSYHTYTREQSALMKYVLEKKLRKK